MLGVAKILENMEIGHNVMHGQWDWMRDPEIHSATWEWDYVCPSDQWKHSHNVVHHTWTNVIGKDRDVGYEILRVTRRAAVAAGLPRAARLQRAARRCSSSGASRSTTSTSGPPGATAKELADAARASSGIGRKAGAGREGLRAVAAARRARSSSTSLAANAVANLIRNVWSYMIIFCGHFPDGVHVFTERTCRGRDPRPAGTSARSSARATSTGGPLFHILSGNLSHQIEHHLFPDMPSNRYPEVAPRVRALSARYGVPYNTGSFSRQFGTTTRKIWRYALPGGRDTASAVPTWAA